MSDLVAFLRARLDEDEQAAERAQGEGQSWAWVQPEALDANRYPSLEQAEHIARHDPARVLAEVAAKRALLDVHRDDYGSCSTCGTAGEYDVPWPCTTVELLALPYANHPDYRSEWAP